MRSYTILSRVGGNESSIFVEETADSTFSPELVWLLSETWGIINRPIFEGVAENGVEGVLAWDEGDFISS